MLLRVCVCGLVTHMHIAVTDQIVVLVLVVVSCMPSAELLNSTVVCMQVVAGAVRVCVNGSRAHRHVHW